MTGFMAIDGVELPTPDTCTFTEYDLDSAQSGRPESGVMYRERVRAKVISLDSITWTALSPEQAVLIRTALLPLSVTVTVRAPWGETTREMYAGDLKWSPAFVCGSSGAIEERWDLSTKLTEK